MSEVKRYDVFYNPSLPGEMLDEKADGGFVRFSAFAAIERRCELLENFVHAFDMSVEARRTFGPADGRAKDMLQNLGKARAAVDAAREKGST